MSYDELMLRAEVVAAAYPDLFRHQLSGVAFLASRRRAILADEMGLGKTRTAIVAAREQEPDGPFLVICPASVKLNWRREILAVEPDAVVQVLENQPVDPAARWIVVNYDRLSRYVSALEEREPAVVIVDEAHYIKNRKTRRAQNTSRLVGIQPGQWPDKATSRTAAYLLTGTPITNRPRDLFNLLRAVRHPVTRNYVKFAKRYCAAYDNGYGLVDEGASNMEELAELLNEVMLRRTKDEALDLPPKVRTWLPLELPTSRVASYEQRALRFLADNPARSGPTWGTFLGLLNKARQELAVLKATMTADFVGDCVEAGQKVVVFTQYHGAVDVFTERFGKSAVTLTGKHTSKQRDAAVRRFQNQDSARVFIGNLQAAGTGITLTAGTHVVFNDLDWVPANHWQAEDRIHRIGQTQTAFATYLYVPGTLDGFVARQLAEKTDLINLIEEGAAAKATMVDDLVELAITSLDIEELMRRADFMGPANPSIPIDGHDPFDFPLLTGRGRPDVRIVTFPSSTKPGVTYTVEVTNGVALCDCPGFEYGGNCRHVKEVRKTLKDQRP